MTDLKKIDRTTIKTKMIRPTYLPSLQKTMILTYQM